MTDRRFPPPWSVEDIGAAYVVKDGSGQQLAYVYFEEEPGRRSLAKLLSKDEARRIGALMSAIHRPTRMRLLIGNLAAGDVSRAG